MIYLNFKILKLKICVDMGIKTYLTVYAPLARLIDSLVRLNIEHDLVSSLSLGSLYSKMVFYLRKSQGFDAEFEYTTLGAVSLDFYACFSNQITHDLANSAKVAVATCAIASFASWRKSSVIKSDRL